MQYLLRWKEHTYVGHLSFYDLVEDVDCLKKKFSIN